jgi:hypothetical protein
MRRRGPNPGLTRLILLAQLLATVATLGWVPGNPAKLVTMLVIWRLGFGHVRAVEFLAMAIVNSFFVFANRVALARGIFGFDHPDLWRMPAYEFLMWGFYTLHAIRLLDGTTPDGGRILHIATAAMFALPFGTIADPALLLAVSAVLLAACLALFHERMDLAYVGYMAALGALVEYVGVWTGQWHYPAAPVAGVPFWSLTMWAGVGLFTRRLILPIVTKGADELQSAAPATSSAPEPD